MRGWGITFVIFGIGSFILPLMGLQFKLLSLFGEYQSIAGVALLIIGIGMIIYHRRQYV